MSSVLPAARENCAVAQRGDGGDARKRRTLLVPVDFTESSLKALDYALSLAKRLHATVTLLHVVDGLYGEGFLDATARLRARAREIADARLKLNLLAASRIHRRVPMECVVRHGNVENEIFRFAETGSVYLVVLGRKVRNAFSRLMFGSVTKEVIETSACAVVVVPESGNKLAAQTTHSQDSTDERSAP
jgi:nucleotide-binding universal stress UspA family protein